MEHLKNELNIKSYTLSVDEPHLSSTRRGIEVNYKANDQIIVDGSLRPSSGCLVLVRLGSTNRLCRYENIYNNEFLFPPLGIDPSHYKDVIIGPVVEHVRISKWLTTKE